MFERFRQRQNEFWEKHPILNLGLALGLIFGLSAAMFLGIWIYGNQKAEEGYRAYRVLAQAICDYRAEKGILPDGLDDLVPEYLNDELVGRGPLRISSYGLAENGPFRVSYIFPVNDEGYQALHEGGNLSAKGTLYIGHVNVLANGAGVSYTFDLRSHESDEGWMLRNGKPDYPPVVPSVPVIQGEELEKTLIEEIDRRIEKYAQIKAEQPNTMADTYRDWYQQFKQKYLESLDGDE